MKRAFAVLLLTSILSTTQAAPPSDESINELMKALQLEQLIGQTITQMDTALKAGIVQGLKASLPGKELTPAQQAAVDKCQQKLSSALRDELALPKTKDVYVQTYKDTFTQEEVNSIVAFYSSPGGKAMMEKLPTAMQKAGELMQARMAPLLKKMEAMQQDCTKEITSAK